MKFRALYRVVLLLSLLSFNARAFAYTADDYYKAGLQLYQAQNYGQAVQYLNAALGMEPNNTAALQLRGNCYYAQGQYQQALNDYQKVQAIAPSNPLAQFIQNLQAKVGAAPSAPAVNPSVPASQPAGGSSFDQGVAYYEQKQYAAAVQMFQKAVQENSNDAKAYYYLGVNQMLMGDTKDAAVALGVSNLKQPNPSVQAYVNRLKSQLSPDDQQWVDSQIANAGGMKTAGAGTEKPKAFGIRLEPAIALLNLADFTTNASTLQSLAQEAQTEVGGDPTFSFNGVVPTGGPDIGFEPVLRLGGDLELGLDLAVLSVGTATDTLKNASGSYSFADSYAISAFYAGLNLRYFLLKGDFQPFISVGPVFEPISINYSLNGTGSSGVTTASGTFSGVAAGAELQLGVDWHLGDTFVVSPFLGYQIASANLFTGNFSAAVNGVSSSYSGQLELEPVTGVPGVTGSTIYAISGNATLPSGSRPVQMDLSGVKAGVGISAYF